jgi:aspartate 1-decarboxylase
MKPLIINVLKSKLHNAVVTGSNIKYSGSIGIDSELIEKAGLREYEKVDIYNITNGERFSTYIIVESKGSRAIVLYGAAARKVQIGDRLIIASYAWIEESELEFFKPKKIILDDKNNIT